jgi:hypothetical protein
VTRLRVLLANEIGGGRGHVTTLRAAAQSLPPDIPKIAALGRDIYGAELAPFCLQVLRAPLIRRPRHLRALLGPAGAATWGDALGGAGLRDHRKLRRNLAFWRQLIVDQDISLLVADLAPLALCAARGLRAEGWEIGIVNLGIGHTVAPGHLPAFPAPLADFTQTFFPEEATLAAINAVGAEFSLPPLPSLPALCDADIALATSFSFLDPYLESRAPEDRIAPLVTASSRLAGAGDEVFVYFSTAELRDMALVEALERLPLPRRGFIPSALPEVKARLQASGMTVIDTPASPDEIADRSRLILHAAPHGTVSLAALAGLPQFAVPQHLEQIYNARQAEAQGILRQAAPGSPDFADRILAACHDRALQSRARSLAEELRQDHPADPLAPLRARLDPLIAKVTAAL